VAARPEAAFCHLGPAARAKLASFQLFERAFAEEGGGLAPDGTVTPVAAVLVAAVRTPPGGDLSSLLLIRRAPHLRANPGEIAFPGGHIDAGELPEEAALRESEEEIALPGASVRLVGALPPVRRESTRGAVAPFVGAVDSLPQLSPNPAEVDEVLLVGLDALSDPSAYEEEIWLRGDGGRVTMPFFALGDDLIWGASARILLSLLERLSTFAEAAAK
jgi:8-oxo-dGTP pyrophosphatase MutT (NUDIX family)